MLSIGMAAYVVIDFVSYVSIRFRSRYLEEATVELDDVLIQMPANRILDLSLGLSALAFLGSTLIASIGNSGGWKIGMVLGAILAVIVFFLPRQVLKMLRKRRLQRFNAQLEDALGSMSSALKAGFSINQALEEVAGENRHPISVEFRLLLQEIRLGVPLETALDNMNRRLGSEDFELVSTAIITARQTGGELTATLERLASLIRERLRITNKLHAMTSMGRMQALIISLMPIVLLFAMFKIMPEMMSAFSTGIGIVALVLSGVLLLCGYLVIRKITTIDV